MDKKLFGSVIIVLFLLLSFVCLSVQMVSASNIEIESRYNTIFTFNPTKIKCDSQMYIRITKPSGKTITKAISANNDYTAEFKNTDTNEAGKYLVDCLGSAYGSINATQREIMVLFLDDYDDEEEEVEEEPIAKLDISTKDKNTGLIVGKQGESKTFTIDGVTAHKIEFIEVVLTSVTLEISSDPIRVTFDVGQNRNVDIDGDGSDDIKVTLKYVDDGGARVEITNIEKYVEKEREEMGIVPEVEEKGRAGLWITILVILIVIGVGYYLLKGKKGKRGQVKFSKQDLGL